MMKVFGFVDKCTLYQTIKKGILSISRQNPLIIIYYVRTRLLPASKDSQKIYKEVDKVKIQRQSAQ